MDKKKKIKERLHSWFLLNFAICFMLCIFSPLDAYYANVSEFWFTLPQMLPGCLVVFLILFAFLNLLAFLFCRTRLSDKLFAGFISLFLFLYIQGNIIPRNYGVLDGDAINWNAYPQYEKASIYLILACAAIFVLLVKKFRKYLNDIAKLESIVMLCMLTITGAFLVIRTPLPSKEESVIVTDKDMFDFSSDHNIIVLVLDSYDAIYMNSLLEENYDGIASIYEDFTYYPDTLGTFSFTRGALPVVLTGEVYENDKPWVDYMKEANEVSPLYKLLQENNFTTGLYTHHNEFFNPDMKDFENVTQGSYEVINPIGFTAKIFKLMAFDYAPHQLKQLFFLDTAEFLEYRTAGDYGTVFDWETVAFKRLTVNSEFTVSKTGNLFKLIHTDGCHSPFTFGEEIQEDGKKHTAIDEISGNNELMRQYLEKLKEAGIYDNSTIIIMGDHGHQDYRQSPLFMVKNVEERHPFAISDAEMSHEYMQDIWKTLTAGETLEEEDIRSYTPKYGKRRYMWCNNDQVEDRANDAYYFSAIEEMYLDGPAYEYENLTSTGKYYLPKGDDYSYKLDQTVEFVYPGTGFAHIVYGHGKSSNYGMTLTENSMMKFDTEDSFENLLVNITLQKAFKWKHHVEVNGHEIELVAQPSYNQKKVYFIIPGEYVTDGKIQIRFYIDADEKAMTLAAAAEAAEIAAAEAEEAAIEARAAADAVADEETAIEAKEDEADAAEEAAIEARVAADAEADEEAAIETKEDEADAAEEAAIETKEDEADAAEEAAIEARAAADEARKIAEEAAADAAAAANPDTAEKAIMKASFVTADTRLWNLNISSVAKDWTLSEIKNTYKRNTPLGFSTADSTGLITLKSGFSGPDETGCKMTEGEASLKLQLIKNPGDLVAHVKYQAPEEGTRVQFYVNDNLIQELNAVGTENVPLIIPEKLVPNGQFNFKIILPDWDETAPDAEQSALYLKELTVFQKSESPEFKINYYKLNSTLGFSSSDPSGKYALEEGGFAEPEEAGSKVIAQSASLTIQTKTLLGELVAHVKYQAPEEGVRVQFYINNELIQDVTAKGTENLALIIPKRLTYADCFLNLKIVLPDWTEDSNAFYLKELTVFQKSKSPEFKINYYKLGSKLHFTSDNFSGQDTLGDSGFAEPNEVGTRFTAQSVSLTVKTQKVLGEVVAIVKYQAPEEGTRVRFYVKDELIQETTARGTESLSIAIPKPLTNREKSLTLKIVLPDWNEASAQEEQNAFYLKEAAVYAKSQAPGYKIKYYKLKSRLKFYAEKSSGVYTLEEGCFAEATENGSAIITDSASLNLHIKKSYGYMKPPMKYRSNRKSPLIVRYIKQNGDLMAYLKYQAPEEGMRVKFYANDELIQKLTAKGTETVSLLIPKEVIHDRTTLSLRIVLPDWAGVPDENDQNQFYVKELMIKKYKAPAP